MAMISCILLSAGLSSRFGSPKALAKFTDSIIIEHEQKILINSRVDKIIVVLGARAEEIKPYLLKHKKINVVYNKDYKLGQTSSFKTGLKAASGSAGIMLLPVDYPFVKTDTINQLIEYFLKNNPPILIPTYQARRGHPPVFSSSLSKDFISLDNKMGINEVLHRYDREAVYLAVDDKGIVATFNTPEELAEIKSQFISA